MDAQAIAPMSSGVEGLDEILRGGLPGPHLYLVQGGPGTGKTTIGLQFLLEGVKQGEDVLYISLSQSRAELEGIARSHGWSLEHVHIEELKEEAEAVREDDQTIFFTSDLRLDRTRERIDEVIEELKPSRVVYDSVLEIRELSGDNSRFRREILGFKARLARLGICAFLIDVTQEYGGDSELESLAHGIFCLDRWLPAYGAARRRIEIRKMRGVNHSSGIHDFKLLSGDGIVVYPRIVPSDEPETKDQDLIKSEVQHLDEMLGGGMEAGTSTLIIGQSGTGKSTIASVYAEAALERGEAVSLFLFEERKETFFRRSEGLGLQLREHMESGLLELFDFDPAELSPGQFAQVVRRSVEENNVRVVVIDSFTGFINALPSKDEGVSQMHTLLKYLSRKGVLTILIVAQHGLLGMDMQTGVDVSYLGDTVLFLRMGEENARINRSIAVVKKRHGPHELDVRDLTISADEGLMVHKKAGAN